MIRYDKIRYDMLSPLKMISANHRPDYCRDFSRNRDSVMVSLRRSVGYRLFKFMMFLAGFILGFFLTYVLCHMYLTEQLSGDFYKHKDQVYITCVYSATCT